MTLILKAKVVQNKIIVRGHWPLSGDYLLNTELRRFPDLSILWPEDVFGPYLSSRRITDQEVDNWLDQIEMPPGLWLSPGTCGRIGNGIAVIKAGIIPFPKTAVEANCFKNKTDSGYVHGWEYVDAEGRTHRNYAPSSVGKINPQPKSA